jgi:cob(I)alamin adenosyltransferase
VLDELTYLCTWGWVPTADVVAMIGERPAHVNLVITGRDAPPDLCAVADTVTEMRNVKHAFDAGIAAMRGIDY